MEDASVISKENEFKDCRAVLYIIYVQNEK